MRREAPGDTPRRARDTATPVSAAAQRTTNTQTRAAARVPQAHDTSPTTSQTTTLGARHPRMSNSSAQTTILDSAVMPPHKQTILLRHRGTKNGLCARPSVKTPLRGPAARYAVATATTGDNIYRTASRRASGRDTPARTRLRAIHVRHRSAAARRGGERRTHGAGVTQWAPTTVTLLGRRSAEALTRLREMRAGRRRTPSRDHQIRSPAGLRTA